MILCRTPVLLSVGPQLFSNPDLSDAGVDLTEENMFVPGAHETGKRQVLFEEDSSDILR